MLQVEYAELSDAGAVRPHNEDSVGHFAPPNSVEARSHGWLFVLADGVGGQERGEVASRLAINAAIREFAAAPGNGNLSAVLTRAVQKANTEVYEAGHGAIATTLVACALRYDRAAIVHVGDSRCYLLRRGRLHQLTRDHTVAGDKPRIGLLSQREAASASKKNVLSRSLGINLFVSAETSEHEVQAGDMLLLCSDGLHGPVKEKELGRIVTASHDLQAVARRLVEVANQLDGGDNVSVQLIRILDIERVGMYRGRPYRLR